MAKFELTEEESLKAISWNEEHLNKFHQGQEPYTGAIGGRLTYTITNTSIGIIVNIECATCKLAGKERSDYAECLTDFSHW